MKVEWLIVDEIQCGLGRTGAFLASSALGAAGDYYLFSKSLGGGLAKVSAVLIASDRYQPGFDLRHSSTFADDDFSSAIALRVGVYQYDCAGSENGPSEARTSCSTRINNGPSEARTSRSNRTKQLVLVHLESGYEGCLRNFDTAKLAHLLLAFLLLVQQLAFARYIAAIAFRRHVLAHG